MSDQIFERCAPSVFLIRLYDEDGNEAGHGSGFILEGTEREWIGVTAQHVIGDAAEARVEMPNGMIGNVEISRENWGRDIALVQIVFDRDVELVPLELELFLPRVGEPVCCIGNPESEARLSAGEVRGKPTIESVQCLQMTAVIGHSLRQLTLRTYKPKISSPLSALTCN